MDSYRPSLLLYNKLYRSLLPKNLKFVIRTLDCSDPMIIAFLFYLSHFYVYYCGGTAAAV